MPPCGPTAGRFMGRAASPAITATRLSSRALHACCRRVPFGSAAISVALATPLRPSGGADTSDQNEATPPLRSVPEFAEQHLGEWQGLDRARFAAGLPWRRATGTRLRMSAP